MKTSVRSLQPRSTATAVKMDAQWTRLLVVQMEVVPAIATKMNAGLLYHHVVPVVLVACDLRHMF